MALLAADKAWTRGNMGSQGCWLGRGAAAFSVQLGFVLCAVECGAPPSSDATVTAGPICIITLSSLCGQDMGPLM